MSVSEIIVEKDSVNVRKYCLKRSDHCQKRLTEKILVVVENDCRKRLLEKIWPCSAKKNIGFSFGNCLKRSTETGLPLSEAIVGNELVIVEKDLTIVGNDVRKRFCQGRKTIVGEDLDIGGAIVEKCLVNVGTLIIEKVFAIVGKRLTEKRWSLSKKIVGKDVVIVGSA